MHRANGTTKIIKNKAFSKAQLTKGNSKYEWLEMLVGDCFTFSSDIVNWKSQVYQASQRYKDRGYRFIPIDEDGVHYAVCIESPHGVRAKIEEAA